MNKLIVALLLFTLPACRARVIVSNSEVDSIIYEFNSSTLNKAVDGNLSFWKTRTIQQPDNTIARTKWTHALIDRFHLKADITDLTQADSLQTQLISDSNVETGQLLTAASIKILRHQFHDASQQLEKAREQNEEKYAVALLTSDVNFELGNYSDASIALGSNKSAFDYAYNFRISKMQHYLGNTEKSIEYMLKAANLTSNSYLRSTALSNAADLYLHIGKVSEAYKLYRSAIKLKGIDIHSFDKIGWIALVHDENLPIATKIFQFLHQTTGSPEPLLFLATAYELTDKRKSLLFATQFENLITGKEYGDMYNKYLVQLYTGILNNSGKAVAVAQREISNRPNPQTFAWYAYALAASGKKELAYKVFKEKISGMKLEAIELFWMGKMMIMLNKNYNAQLFFKEAEKNINDLTLAMARELKDYLDK